MTAAHLAFITGASQKWIQNARRLLGRSAANTPHEARWLGIVHMLHTGLGCSLNDAARIADVALHAPTTQTWLRIPVDEDGRAELVINLLREHSVYLARLAWTLANPAVERRGRPAAKRPPRIAPLKRAIQYGVDVTRLSAGLHRSVSERLQTLDDNAAFLAAGGASVNRKHKKA